MPSSPDLRQHDRFVSAYIDSRDITVWLPPGYEDDARRYPVLYMHDGQNLFDPDRAFQGRPWRLGDTAAELIEAHRIEPLIVVGIHNTGTRRIQEYTPTHDSRLGGGLAADYGYMIVDELKPFIDETYRTNPTAATTALGGSSLGGLVTLYLGLVYPQKFSKLAVLSPSVWWDRRAILKSVRNAMPVPRPKVWVDMGTAEGRRGLEDARLLKAALVGAGWVPGLDLHYAEYEGATHSEDAWADRVGPLLQWLFPSDHP